MNKNRFLLIISIVLISIGGAFIVVGTALTLIGKAGYGDIFMGVSGIFGLAALVILIISDDAVLDEEAAVLSIGKTILKERTIVCKVGCADIPHN